MNETSTQLLIDTLELEPHPEGGFFRRTYESDALIKSPSDSRARRSLTCIFYLLTSESHIGYLHVNTSDIVHFFHSGSPIEYTLISPAGDISTVTLGPNIERGHRWQLTVPGGWWKSSQLKAGSFGLISEAVTPGFEYEDMRFIQKSELIERLPQDHARSLSRFCRS